LRPITIKGSKIAASAGISKQNSRRREPSRCPSDHFRENPRRGRRSSPSEREIEAGHGRLSIIATEPQQGQERENSSSRTEMSRTRPQNQGDSQSGEHRKAIAQSRNEGTSPMAVAAIFASQAMPGDRGVILAQDLAQMGDDS